MIYQLNKICFSYPHAARPTLNEVSLTVNEGDIVSLLGRNGSGKSTLLSCMLRLLKPQSGEILLQGKNIFTLSEREIAGVVGYVPQNHQPSFAYTVLDFVMMGCASRISLFSSPGKRDRVAADISLEELGIGHLKDRPYTELSGGERQQATIARAIVSAPQIVLFDEPTAYLDYANQLRVLRIIKSLSRKGYAVVVTTHNPDHALLLGGKSALLDEGGHLRMGRTRDIVTQEALSATFREDIRLEHIASLDRMACLYPNL